MRLSALILFAGVVACIGNANAQYGGYALGGGLASQLISNKDLQEELKLSEGQIEKLKEYAEKNTPKPGGGGGYGGWTGNDLDMIEYYEAQIRTMKARVEFIKTTLEKSQYERLIQLETQRLGYRAFLNDRIAKELKITDDQKKRFTEISTDLAKETQALYTNMKGGFNQEKYAEAMKKTVELNNFALEAVEKELNDDQKAQWFRMTGKKFDVTKLQQQYRPMTPGK